MKVRDYHQYNAQTLSLKRADGTTEEHKGNYLIVDNGYHEWRILVEPTKYPVSKQDTMFSKWLESVRKDVECFFGRLKGRFRILKLPLYFRYNTDIDNVWFTCFILHNLYCTNSMGWTISRQIHTYIHPPEQGITCAGRGSAK